NLIENFRSIALLTFVLAIDNMATAQSYHLKSFDNVDARITLSYKLRSSRTLAVSYMKDTVFLADYMEIIESHVVQEKFLQITYDVRGGTGYDTKNTVFLCVDQSKIKMAAIVTSYGLVEGPGIKGLYTAKFKLTNLPKRPYTLIVDVSDSRKDEKVPQK